MTAKEFRSLALFAGAVIAVSFFSPSAAMLLAGAVFIVIAVRAAVTGGNRILTKG